MMIRDNGLNNRLQHGGLSPVIPVQVATSDNPSVVCIPGAGASVTCFLPLADSVGRDVSVYGMQSRGLDGRSRPHTTVEAAAADYLEWLEPSHAGRAYQLLGHSFGGWIAFEMACRLTRAGANVARLVLLDTQPPSQGEEAPCFSRLEVLLELIESLEQASGNTLQLGREDLESSDETAQLRRLAQAMRPAGALVAASALESVANMVAVFELNMNTAYVPALQFPGEMILVHPESPVSDDKLTPGEALRTWARHARQVVRIEVPGNHMSMLASPGIDRIVRELRLDGECRPLRKNG